MLIAVAIWLLSRFISPSASMFLWALLCGLSASQMGAFEAAKTGTERFIKGLGLFLALYAALLFVGALTGAQNPLAPLEKLTSTQTSNIQTVEKLPFKVITSNTELDEHIKIATQQGRPVLVDFYADWCISCIVMENEVFPLPNIKSKLKQFYLVKADVTNNSKENKELLDRFGLFGPPSVLFFDKSGQETESLRIIGEISTPGFEQRLIKALI
jgi:thiol:disulfide interchange protein DsbD